MKISINKEMFKKLLVILLLIPVVCFANQFEIRVDVPLANGLNIKLFKFDNKGTADSVDDAKIGEVNKIDFGELELRQIEGEVIFLPKDNSYFLADVKVNGGGPWQIYHNVIGEDFLGNGENNLGSKIVVTFVKKNKNNQEILDREIIKNSNKIYNSIVLKRNDLGIYYEIVDGANDPIEAETILSTQDAKNYSGIIEITLVTL